MQHLPCQLSFQSLPRIFSVILTRRIMQKMQLSLLFAPMAHLELITSFLFHWVTFQIRNLLQQVLLTVTASWRPLTSEGTMPGGRVHTTETVNHWAVIGLLYPIPTQTKSKHVPLRISSLNANSKHLFFTMILIRNKIYKEETTNILSNSKTDAC